MPFFKAAAGLKVSLASQATCLPLTGSVNLLDVSGAMIGSLAFTRTKPPNAHEGKVFFADWPKQPSGISNTNRRQVFSKFFFIISRLIIAINYHPALRRVAMALP